MKARINKKWWDLMSLLVMMVFFIGVVAYVFVWPKGDVWAAPFRVDSYYAVDQSGDADTSIAQWKEGTVYKSEVGWKNKGRLRGVIVHFQNSLLKKMALTYLDDLGYYTAWADSSNSHWAAGYRCFEYASESGCSALGFSRASTITTTHYNQGEKVGGAFWNSGTYTWSPGIDGVWVIYYGEAVTPTVTMTPTDTPEPTYSPWPSVTPCLFWTNFVCLPDNWWNFVEGQGLEAIYFAPPLGASCVRAKFSGDVTIIFDDSTAVNCYAGQTCLLEDYYGNCKAYPGKYWCGGLEEDCYITECQYLPSSCVEWGSAFEGVEEAVYDNFFGVEDEEYGDCFIFEVPELADVWSGWSMRMCINIRRVTKLEMGEWDMLPILSLATISLAIVAVAWLMKR